MRRMMRPASLVAALVIVVTSFVGSPLPEPAAAAAAPTVIAGKDYATTVFGDPWDFSNPSDLLLDNRGPAYGLSRAVIGGGYATITIAKPAYVSPLWAGYPGSLRLGRDGALPANMIDASTYTRVRLHAFSSSYLSSALQWFSCGAPSGTCIGGMPMSLSAGWNEIDLPIRNNPLMFAAGKQWTGKIQGLRFAMNPKTTVQVRFDYLRVYQPSDNATITWSSPYSSSAQLWWGTGGTAFTPVTGHYAGIVNGAVSQNANSPLSTPVSAYPPDTNFYAVTHDGVAHFVGRTARQPIAIIDSPAAGGCGDYARTVLGRPWTFTSARSLAAWGNAKWMTFSGGAVHATNAPPRQNDPWIRLPVQRGGLDGRVWHHLTIVEGYNGPFDLRNAPGGGTMARVVWMSAGKTFHSQTNDIITYSGKRTITIDLGMNYGTLTESNLPWSLRYAFASYRPVTQLRWDPNEDPGARRWHVYSVRLGRDCATSTSFPMTWHDVNYVPGSTATIYAVNSAGTPYQLTTMAQAAGTNVYWVRAARLAAGRYTLRVDVTSPDGPRYTARAQGVLVIKR